MAGDWKEDAVGTLAAETGLTRDQARHFVYAAASLQGARVAAALARAQGDKTPGAYRHLKDSLLKGAAKDRKPGYYWVKEQGEWIIAQWGVGEFGGCWECFGEEKGWGDDVWDKIDERPIERQP